MDAYSRQTGARVSFLFRPQRPEMAGSQPRPESPRIHAWWEETGTENEGGKAQDSERVSTSFSLVKFFLS